MINNDKAFKQALSQLNSQQQRQVASLFVKNIVTLSNDERLSHMINELSAIENMTEEDRLIANKMIKNIMINAHTRCGASCDWSEQQVYFVARAVLAVLEKEPSALGAASNARMARTSSLIDSDNENTHDESAEQYKILNDFLNAEGVKL